MFPASLGYKAPRSMADTFNISGTKIMSMSFARALAIMIPFILVAQMPAGAAPERPVSITITLETSEADLLWNASEQYVYFNGTLTLDDPVQREIDVSLFTTAPPGWSALCSPEVNKFHSAGQRNFTCSVHPGNVRENMTGIITIQGMAYWRGDSVASNQSPPFSLHVTKLVVEKNYNLTNPRKIDFTTRIENILPHLTVLAVLVATVAVAAVVWRWRKRRSRRDAAQ